MTKLGPGLTTPIVSAATMLASVASSCIAGSRSCAAQGDRKSGEKISGRPDCVRNSGLDEIVAEMRQPIGADLACGIYGGDEIGKTAVEIGHETDFRAFVAPWSNRGCYRHRGYVSCWGQDEM
jgi:hypothetical protein